MIVDLTLALVQSDYHHFKKSHIVYQLQLGATNKSVLPAAVFSYFPHGWWESITDLTQMKTNLVTKKDKDNSVRATVTAQKKNPNLKPASVCRVLKINVKVLQK